MAKLESNSIELAKNILRGQHAELEALLRLGDELIRERAFGYAHRILARARRNPEVHAQRGLRLRLAHRRALATYKDADLPADARLDRALEILREEEDLQNTKNQETLGLAGAIHRRKWEIDSHTQHLERSLAYYRRGYNEGPASDYGYTGINAAFVLDLLASAEEAEASRAGTTSESANTRRNEARHIREDLVARLPGLASNVDRSGQRIDRHWWYLVTVAEAQFGLKNYPEARRWLNLAAVLKEVPDWERESTARQLASLARLQDGSPDSSGQKENSEAWRALSEFLGHNLAAVRSAFVGKVGLALSGGGFRASLFHIGVLAKLAEFDVLRNVEVLSCVSGGSIVGAHYYLEVRKLLESKPDREIRREDYIDIVSRMERDFLAGVQRNIRTRVAAEWATNLKMIFLPHYSRTMRAGELYEREIFSKVKHPGARSQEYWLNDLKVQPAGEEANFAPKNHNWRRSAKVPILILNATCLNTGHNWQFTATWMGEPPAGISTEIDGNYRFRRMYYEDAPAPHRRVRLGHAVAASACVPGLFEPLALAGLYPERTVRLVDGGVHDNQGTAGLLEQGCTVLLVSDASGQMDAQDYPRSGLLSVPLRSNSILQARVREAQYYELAARKRSWLLQGLMFVHLKKDLDVSPVDWLECQIPHEGSGDEIPLERRGPLTRYGIQKKTQKLLAAIRTDLDSFSDSEACALMTSGYLMTEYEFPRTISGFPHPSEARSKWRFLALERTMKEGSGSEALTKQLAVSCYRAFKIWKLSRLLQVCASVAALGLVGALILTYDAWWSRQVFSLTFGMIAAAIIALVAGRVFSPIFARLVRFRKTLNEIAIGAGMSLLGFIAARLHLWIFDRWFLRQGALNRVAGAELERSDLLSKSAHV